MEHGLLFSRSEDGPEPTRSREVDRREGPPLMKDERGRVGEPRRRATTN